MLGAGCFLYTIISGALLVLSILLPFIGIPLLLIVTLSFIVLFIMALMGKLDNQLKEAEEKKAVEKWEQEKAYQEKLTQYRKETQQPTPPKPS